MKGLQAHIAVHVEIQPPSLNPQKLLDFCPDFPNDEEMC